jgi:hypothetical protein
VAMLAGRAYGALVGRARIRTVLPTSGLFANRKDSLGTPEHRSAFSNSAASPLTSAFSAAGGLRGESPHCLWLRL